MTGRSQLPYDGIGDFYVRKYEDFENAFADPEYKERIQPDEVKFVDPESLSFSVGVEVVGIEEGKGVVDGRERMSF